MPLNFEQMASEIDALMEPLDEPDARDARLKSIKAICQGIVTHFQLNATLVAPVGLGLATGPGGGPVAGVLNVTVPVIK